ncbi:MAG: hypothetical protein JO312_23125 [Hyphomicrobiales bacterium]|nr:hypothetical protein [Hyphomicrobiales bacterium]
METLLQAPAVSLTRRWRIANAGSRAGFERAPATASRVVAALSGSIRILACRVLRGGENVESVALGWTQFVVWPSGTLTTTLLPTTCFTS